MAKYIKYKGQKILVDYAKSDALGNEINIANLQTKLTTTQQQAVDSGINATKVQNYDNYSTNKQDTLHSGTNIKTINGQSILGSGDLEISGGSGGLKVLDLIMESVSIVAGQTASSEITDIIKINIINEIRNLVSDYSETPIPLPSSNYIVSYYFGMCAIQASIRASSDNKRVLLLTAPLSFLNIEAQHVENIMGKLVLTPDNDTNPTKYTLIIEKDISSSSNLILNIGVNDDATSLKPITEEQKQIVKEMCIELANAQNGTATREMSVYFFNGLAFYISQNILYSPFEENMYIDFLVDRGEKNGLKPVRITIGNIKYSSASGIDTSNITMEGGRIENYQYKLVSGTNIKTINGESLLGSGNISVDGYTDLGLISGTPSELATQVYNALYYDTGAVKSAIVLCETEGTFDEDGIIGSGNVVFTACGDVQMLAISYNGIALLDTNGRATKIGYENFVNLRELSLSGGTLLPVSLASLNSYFTNRKLFNIVGSINDNSFVASNVYLIEDTYYIEIPSNNKTYYTVVINSTNGVYTINQYQYATISEIPTNVSDLTNDANYITSSALDNYYDKSSIDNLLSQLKKATMQVVSELPSTGEEGIIYLVGTSSPYEQYIRENGAYIDLGSTSVDLTGYVKGTGLTADRIILGNGNSNIKTSSYSISNSSSTSTTILLTAKAINDLINSKGFATTTALNQGLETKQEKLVSGTNIKTINGQSLLGTGNVAIQEITITNNNDDTYTFTWEE